jgi:hypothetical protein
MPLPPVRPNPLAWPLRPSKHVFATDLNDQLQQTVGFLSQPPAFWGAQGTTAQSIPNTTNTDVVLDTIFIDNYQGMNDSALNRWTVPSNCGGIYLAIGEIPYITASASNFICQFNQNGTINAVGSKIPSTTGGNATPMDIDLISLSGGQYVTLSAFQNSGGAIVLENDTFRQPYLYLQWVALPNGVGGVAPLAVPNPRTWALNDLCTDFAANAAGQGSFNVEIFNSLNFLSYVPYMRAIQDNSQAGIATGVDTHIVGLVPTVGIDNYGAYNQGTDTWTAPVSGAYFVAANVSWSNGAAASYVTEVRANLSGTPANWLLAAAAGQNNTALSGSRIIRFTAGDTLQLYGRQNSGGNLSTAPGTGDVRLITLWIGG